MQSLSDDERRAVLGEVLFDELKLIREYVQEIPDIKEDLREVKERLTKVERIIRIHEVDVRQIRQHLQLS